MELNVTMLIPFDRFEEKRDQILNMPDGSTIRGFLETMCNKYGPDFKERLFSPSGNINDDIMVIIDGKNIASSKKEELDSGLRDKADIMFCSVISGG